MVVIDDVGLRFGEVQALDHISLEIQTGELVAVVGPSGSGKSSLLRVIAGLERPAHGRVLLAGQAVASAETFVEPERRQVGMVFQDYALFPHLTVAQNVAFGLRGRAGAAGTVANLLARVGLDRLAGSYPHTLSGGERQRVALVRALAPAPRVLVMDEPFSGLDDRLRDQVRRDTLAVLHELDTTTIIVTHDPNEALRVADRVALLCGGRLVQYGPAETVYSRPASVFAARFFSAINELTGVSLGGQIDTPLGTFPAPDLADGAVARVCLRPHHLQMSRERTAVEARVLSTEFAGDAVHVVAEVRGLPAPVSLLSHNGARVAVGDVIYLMADTPHAMIVAQ